MSCCNVSYRYCTGVLFWVPFFSLYLVTFWHYLKYVKLPISSSCLQCSYRHTTITGLLWYWRNLKVWSIFFLEFLSGFVDVYLWWTSEIMLSLGSYTEWYQYVSNLSELWLREGVPFLTQLQYFCLMAPSLCPPGEVFGFLFWLCPVECPCLLQTISCHFS